MEKFVETFKVICAVTGETISIHENRTEAKAAGHHCGRIRCSTSCATMRTSSTVTRWSRRILATLAAMNKCLAESNKSPDGRVG